MPEGHASLRASPVTGGTRHTCSLIEGEKKITNHALCKHFTPLLFKKEGTKYNKKNDSLGFTNAIWTIFYIIFLLELFFYFICFHDTASHI